VDESVEPHLVEETLDALKALCEMGQLQSYGFELAIAPYVYHTPPLKEYVAFYTVAHLPCFLASGNDCGNDYGVHVSSYCTVRRSGPWMLLPMTMEAEHLQRAPYAEWVVYSISPTTAVPATYPMLDTDELGQDHKFTGRSYFIPQDTVFHVRMFTCAYLCFLAATPHVMHVFITGSDEEKRKFTRIALNPLTLRFGGRAAVKYETPRVLAARKIRVRRPGARRAAPEKKRKPARDSDSESETEVSDDEDEDTSEELDMMTGLYGSDIEVPMGQMMDDLCPALKSTPLLQDKALRVVMSVGVEALMLDAERSAMLGKFRLTPDDMLPSQATDNVFENFCLTVETTEEEAGSEQA
jgi:hypothetical protein